MNRLKNITILTILITFLFIVAKIPVTCIFKLVTGISCPACGMTRAFLAILNFNFLEAIIQNILSIPCFIFIIFSVIILLIEFFQNKFEYIPKLLKLFSKHYTLILSLLLFSFIFNNLKVAGWPFK